MSLVPSLTEMVFAVEAGHRVVGVSDFGDFPPETARLPRVGGSMHPGFETIVALDPDVILADQWHAVTGTVTRLRALGLHVDVFPVTTAETFEDLYRVMEDLGRLLGVPEKAQTVVHEMKRSVSGVLRMLEGVTPVTVYCELWEHPMITASGGSFQGHLLELAGGKNIAAALPGRSPRIGTEFVLQSDPSVILLPGGAVVPGLASPETVAARPGWTRLRALAHDRVYTIDHAHFSRHGPRSVLAVQEIARLLHPGLPWD